MQSSVVAQPHPFAIPAFDGTAVLPRVLDWPRIQSKLARVSTHALDGSFLDSELGSRYARQAEALGLKASGASVRLKATQDGFSATIALRTGDRALEDRWDVELDSNGMLRGCVSDHHAALWQFETQAFSRFLSLLLAGV